MGTLPPSTATLLCYEPNTPEMTQPSSATLPRPSLHPRGDAEDLTSQVRQSFIQDTQHPLFLKRGRVGRNYSRFVVTGMQGIG